MLSQKREGCANGLVFCNVGEGDAHESLSRSWVKRDVSTTRDLERCDLALSSAVDFDPNEMFSWGSLNAVHCVGWQKWLTFDALPTHVDDMYKPQAISRCATVLATLLPVCLTREQVIQQQAEHINNP